MLILSEKALKQVLKMTDVIKAVEEGFILNSNGYIRMPERLRLDLPESDGVMLEMPSAIIPSGEQDSFEPALGTKIVSAFNANPDRGVELIQASYLLLNPFTGQPEALMDGKFITAIRTAAVSAVATKYLAPPQPWRLGLFGAGVQSLYHAEAMAAIGSVETVLISSRNKETAARLARTISDSFGLPCETTTAEENVASSNLICTCTSFPTPLFDGSLVKPGTHINAVGAFTPATRELDSECMSRSRIVIDDRLAAGIESGEILLAIAEGAIGPSQIAGTLSELVSGSISGRPSAESITVFKSCGLAFEDLVTARLAFSEAKRLGIGVEMEM